MLTALDWTTAVTVELDDHHDSDLINAGLAADAGYKGTFRHEADSDLDELRVTFRRKAHAAAMERSLTGLLRRDPDRAPETLHGVTLADLPAGPTTDALLRRRATLGLGTAGTCRSWSARRRPVPGRAGPAEAADGPVGADLDRGQRPLLPGAAEDPLPGVRLRGHHEGTRP